jgi:hypothetical protein
MSIKFENTAVVGWEHAIRGMRNPKNSWHMSDSGSCDTWVDCHDCGYYKQDPNFKCGDPISDTILIGPNDHKLMMSLAKGGPVHAKYRRMITVYVDITAPLYWWKEFDTYKVGTVANSCSTMHKIHEKEFTLDDFSFDDDLMEEEIQWNVDIGEGLEELNHTHFDICVDRVVEVCEALRKMYNHYTKRAKDPNITEAERKHFREAAKKYWRMLIQYLPTSYNQKRTVMLNYEVLANMDVSRDGHKLDEWRDLRAWIRTLPYSEIITGKEKE